MMFGAWDSGRTGESNLTVVKRTVSCLKLMRLFPLLIMAALLPYVSHSADALNESQFLALVDKTIIEMMRSWPSEYERGSSIDVLVVKDEVLRDRLTKKYQQFEKWLKFENEGAVVFDKKSQSNVHKASKKDVYLNEFSLEKQNAATSTIRWNRIISSLGGFSKTVTMKLIDGKWDVTEIKLDSVS
jgi:hypothetical protein